MSDGSVVKKLNYTHEALIEQIILNPQARQRDLAALFGYTESWLSLVMSSDVFKEALAARRAEIINPALIAGVEERLEGLARQSLDKLRANLDVTNDPELALQCAQLSTKALGFGARDRSNVGVQNNYVVVMPQKSKDSVDWKAQHAPSALGGLTPASSSPIDVTPEV